MPIMMFCVVGFASALRQVRAHLSAQAWMVVLLLWFSVLQIGEASHPAPDAEFFSFVLGMRTFGPLVRLSLVTMIYNMMPTLLWLQTYLWVVLLLFWTVVPCREVD